MEIDEWTFIQHRVSMNNQRYNYIILYFTKISTIYRRILINEFN